MTVSPDLPGFVEVDVTGLDYTDPSNLVDLALARAGELLPEWEPREGNVEVVLLEEFAPLIAALIARVDGVLPALTAQLVGMSGLPKDPGAPAQVQVEVALSDTLGHVVPAGTALILGDPNGEPLVTATVDADIAVAVGESTGTGSATVDDAGVVDDLSTATPVLVVDAVAYVDEVTVTAVTTAGRDPETDDAYLARGSAWLASMTQLLARAEQFGLRAVTDARVGRALGVQRWNGVSEVPGTDVGYVTVLLLDPAGAALDAGVMEQVRAGLAAQASAELTVVAQAPTVTAVPVTVTVTGRAGYTAATVQANVETALAAYLYVMAWPWGDDVLVSRIRQVIETTDGVDAITTLTAPAVDVTVGPLGLATAGAIAVTVA